MEESAADYESVCKERHGSHLSRDDVDFVAKRSKVHLLPADTIKAFKMTPLTKRHIEKEFAAHGGNGYVWVDQHDTTESFVQLEGSMIVIKEY